MQATLVIPATLDALEAITPFIGTLMPDQSSHLRLQIALAVHELCMNIVQHGYAGLPGSIEVRATVAGPDLHFEVMDTAPNAFVAVKGTVTSADPFALPDRGWGLTIVRKVMDEVAYSRHDSGNVWRLAKHYDGGTTRGGTS